MDTREYCYTDILNIKLDNFLKIPEVYSSLAHVAGKMHMPSFNLYYNGNLRSENDISSIEISISEIPEERKDSKNVLEIRIDFRNLTKQQHMALKLELRKFTAEDYLDAYELRPRTGKFNPSNKR